MSTDDAQRAQQRINCRVCDVADGSKQLIFEIAKTRECVGELRIAVVNTRYLPVIAHLFTQWVARGGQPRARDLDAAIRHAIVGGH